MKKIWEAMPQNRKMWFCFALLMAICLVISILSYNAQATISFEGENLRLVSKSYNGLLLKNEKGDAYELLAEDAEIYFMQECKLFYKGKAVSYEWGEDGITVVMSDGTVYRDDWLNAVYSSDIYYTQEKLPDEVQLMYDALDMFRNTPSRAVYFGFCLLSALLGLLGLGMLFYTEGFWRFNTMFTVIGGEPTDWALFSIQLSGVICVGAALFLPVLLLFVD